MKNHLAFEGVAPTSPLRLLWCGVPSLRALSPAHHTTSAALVPSCATLGNFILRGVALPLAPCVSIFCAPCEPSGTQKIDTHYAFAGAPLPPHPRVLPPLCACLSSGAFGHGGARALRCASLYCPKAPCGVVCFADRSLPPPFGICAKVAKAKRPRRLHK